MQVKSITIVAALCFATPSLAQSFNIDVGKPGSAPPPGYAAAGEAGLWNTVRAEHVEPFTPGPTPEDVMLRDINGVLTGVGFHQFGATDLSLDNDPSVAGDDAALLSDSLITHSEVLESCMYLNGLENGTYEVLVYAWMPNEPQIENVVRFDFVPETTPVGGSWPGRHEEGVTYARYIIEVTNGHIGFHVGIAPGGDTGVGAAFNGIQLSPLGEDIAVPVASSWGVIVLALSLTAVVTLLLRRPAAIV